MGISPKPLALARDHSGVYVQVLTIYRASDGEATRALLAELHERGPLGFVVANLLRAAKNSERAKLYHGGRVGLFGRGSYRRAAYDRKEWAIGNLDTALLEHAGAAGIRWGWALDPQQACHNQVLYVDTPRGQVSFHTAQRGKGPDYPGEWDGVKNMGAQRICLWAADILTCAEEELPCYLNTP